MPGSDKDARRRPILMLPQDFRRYDGTPITPETSVVVGAVTDQDGTHQRPLVALASGANRVVTWAKHLDGLEDAYQARATHCVLGDGALYVLLQSDTHPTRALSQTLLNIARLTTEGEVQAVAPLHISEAGSHAYSAFVSETPATFRWKDSRLVVAGEYFLISAPGRWHPFTAIVAQDLSREIEQ